MTKTRKSTLILCDRKYAALNYGRWALGWNIIHDMKWIKLKMNSKLSNYRPEITFFYVLSYYMKWKWNEPFPKADFSLGRFRLFRRLFIKFSRKFWSRTVRAVVDSRSRERERWHETKSQISLWMMKPFCGLIFGFTRIQNDLRRKCKFKLAV